MAEEEVDLYSAPTPWWFRVAMAIPGGMLGMGLAGVFPSEWASGSLLLGCAAAGAVVTAVFVAPRLPNPNVLRAAQERLNRLDPATVLAAPPGRPKYTRAEAVDQLEEARDLVRGRSRVNWPLLAAGSAPFAFLLWLEWASYQLSGTLRWWRVPIYSLYWGLFVWITTNGFYGRRTGRHLDDALTAQLDAIRAWPGDELPPDLIPSVTSAPSLPDASDEPPRSTS